jgi:hypothetical protein
LDQPGKPPRPLREARRRSGAQSEAEYEADGAFLTSDCHPNDPSILRRFDSATQTATYFDPDTGEIAVKSKKGIVTYFKLDRGVDYFNNPQRVKGEIIPSGTQVELVDAVGAVTFLDSCGRPDDPGGGRSRLAITQ